MPKNKKDSVFSGIFPANEPAPVQQAPRPAADEQVAALNRKIELMERNIVGQLEKKLADAPPPQPPSPAIPAVISKIAEMENRFKEFQEKFLLGAAQMKNIEESKISARREIEELLKVVREQQKYSELDRQMHDQLEKAWGRVEELEKRMMEVYAAAAKRPAEAAVPAAPAATPGKIAAEVMKAVEAGLAARFKALEDKLQEVAQKEPVPAPRVIDSVAAAVAAALDNRFQLLSEEALKASSERAAWTEALRGAEGAVEKEALGAIREGFREAGGVFVRHIDGASQEGKERIDSLARMLVGHMDELAAASRDNSLKTEMLGAALRAEKEKDLSALSAAAAGLERSVCARIKEAAVAAAVENAAGLEKIRETCALSAANFSALSAVEKNLSELEGRLGGMLSGIRGFIKALEPVRLESLLGVSGAMVRRSFEDARGIAEALEKDRVFLATAKGEIAANVRRLAPGQAGEEK